MDAGKRRGCLTAVLIAAGCFLLIVFLLVGVFLYQTEFRREELTEFHSPDGAYTLTVTSIGEPDWPFGAAHCELALKRGRKRISRPHCEVWNDGGWAYPENFAVQWDEEKATVIVSSEEALDEKYELWFDGSVTSLTLYEDTAAETAAVSLF